MSIFEYDEEFHMGIIRAEEREEGRIQGIKQGMEQGIKQGIEQGIGQGLEQGEKKAKQDSALRMIRRGKLTLKEIAEDSGLSLEEIEKMAGEENLWV